jgi:hypothetical protein
MSYIKNKLIGGFDLTFLFGRGIEKFSGTKREALLSLIPTLVTLPPTIVFAYLYPPKGMETGYGHAQILLMVMTHFILAFIISNLVIAGLCFAFERRDKFWLFFSAGNWTGLAFSIVTSPLVIIACTGLVARDEMDRALALVTIYSYVITACILWRALKINWQLAGAAAIAVLFVDQELSHALFILQGIPIPW